MYTPYRKSDFIKDALEQQKADKRRSLMESGDNELNNYENNKKAVNIYTIKEQRIQKEKNYAKFLNELKTEYLSEGICHYFNNAIDSLEESEVNNEEIRKGYVYRFIEENGGAIKLLSKFRTSTTFLSELALMIEDAVDKAKEKIDKDDVDTFVSDTEVKSEFIEDLKEKDNEEITDIIQNRVTDAVGDFVQKNKEDKETIEKIAKDAEEKIADTTKEKVQESYRIDSNKKILAIQTKKPGSIFEAMVRAISKSIIKDDKFKDVFLNENKIDFDTVMESAIVMYSFFETVSTLKMVDVDEAYIKDVYESLK